MTVVTVVEQTGELCEKNVKNINKKDYYKYCGFRKPLDFDIRTTWNDVKINTKIFSVELWSRNNGKANTENKYDFPPPIDNDLYFGKCVLIGYENGEIIDLDNKLWYKIYEHLFGGFEDLDKEEERSEDESDMEDVPRTKEGYVKDNFVVSDSENLVLCSNDGDGDDERSDSVSDDDDSDLELQTEPYELSDDE